MAVFLFANNTATTLAGPIAAGATSFSVAAGTGSLYPNPATGQQFAITLRSQASSTQREIVYCTARSGDTFTVIRGQEGTTPLSFVAGDFVDNYLTAGTTASFTQASQLQQQAGNYGVDTGTTNSIIATLNPAPSALSQIIGSPFRIKVLNSNNGAATLTLGSLPSTVIVNPDGTSLLPNQVWPGGIAEFVYNGSNFVLISTPGYHPGFYNIRSFNSSGTFTIPAGITILKIRLWAAGGGGGGAISGAASGAGGGAGGYSEGIFTGLVPGNVLNVIVGVGGTGGTSAPGNGGNGTNSSVSGLISAVGGTGGSGSGGGASIGVGTSGSGSGGAINLSGGGAGVGFQIGSGFAGGMGAPAPFGSIPTLNVGARGVPGIFPGGGGNGSSAAASGGAGAGGFVILEW